jgi:hypothetical protein
MVVVGQFQPLILFFATKRIARRCCAKIDKRCQPLERFDTLGNFLQGDQRAIFKVFVAGCGMAWPLLSAKKPTHAEIIPRGQRCIEKSCLPYLFHCF